MHTQSKAAAWQALLLVAAAALLPACKDNPVDEGIDGPPPRGTEIGPAGGMIASSDGRLTLHVPKGALERTQRITIDVIGRDDLGAEFDEIIDAMGLGTAYELGPDGLSFLQPVTVRFESDQTPGDTLAALAEFLLTSADGQVEVLDSLRLQVDADGEATVSGLIDHFTPLVTTQANNGVSFFVFGVPERLEVGDSFQADAVVAGSEAGKLSEIVTVLDPATYRDESSAPVEPSFDPTSSELEADGVERYSKSFRYSCAEVGLGVYGADLSVRVRFDLDSGPITAESYADFTTTVDCVTEMPQPDTVRVALAGDGSGQVASNPAGIACPEDCEEPFDRGTTLTLTATPDEGSVFTGWGGEAPDDCEVDPVCTFSVDVNRNEITATFGLAESAQILEFGAEPVDDFAMRFDLRIEYEYDLSDLDVTIDPDDGSGPQEVQLEEADAEHEYTGSIEWEYDEGGMFPVMPEAAVSGSSGERTSQVISIGEVTLTLVKDGTGDGTVTGVAAWGAAAISCGPGCTEDSWTGLRSAGAGINRVSLSAIPESGSTFDGWGGDLIGSEGCTTSDDCLVFMNEHRTVTATFNAVDAFETGVFFLALIGQPEALFYLGSRSAGVAFRDDVPAFGDISGRHPIAVAGSNGFVVIDLATKDVLLDETDLAGPFFGVVGATQSPPGPGSAAMLLAFGAENHALHRFDRFGSLEFDGTTYDAFPAGGSPEADVVSFVRPGGGVGFYVYDDAQDLYVPAEVELDDALFEGELVSAYLHSNALSEDAVPQPRGPVLVLTRAVESGLYLARWGGSDPVRVADVGLDARKIRCIDAGELICAVSVFGEDRIAVFRWDGENAPEAVGSAAVGDGPVGIDLTLLPTGNVGVVVTGFNDQTLTEVELSPQGNTVNSSTRPVDSDCRNPGHAVYIRQAPDLYVVGTCYGSDSYFVDESAF